MSVYFSRNIRNFRALRLIAYALFAVFGLALAAQAAGIQGGDKGNILLLTVNAAGKDSIIAIKLRPDLAPRHVEQIKKLVQEGAYNNVVFHRVIDGFMAQTGDVRYGNRQHYDADNVGTGGSHYADIPAEFSDEPFKRGTVGMARSQNPDSANSQFFICYADAAFLNKQYTIVGNVVKGMNNVDRLKKGSNADNGKVEGKPDYIVKAQLADFAP
ncbi:peptidylprolyl isomerase [Candidatus Tokpelaia sp.]|nr:peptidylprolyl isomerase [Candidatus Tokpelaia sp.]KAA6405552.1 peptidylprolyl isomerase [Candidatus Tokpelaia sp.]